MKNHKIFKGANVAIFQVIHSMVECHDGHLDHSKDDNLIFTFRNADDKHNCFEAIVSMSLINVTMEKLNGLHFSVNI